MNEAPNISKVLNQLKGFKRKFYLNKLVKGVLLSSAIIIAAFLTITFTEYTFRLNSPSRLVLLLLFLFVCLTITIKLIGYPLYKIVFINKQISDEEAAKIIGKYYNKIDDKLLNIIQLYGKDKGNSLVMASIDQNASFITNYNFKESVSLKKGSRKILPYLLGAVIVFFFVRISSPDLIKEGSYRVLRYQENFTPPAPFNFLLLTSQLDGYKGDNFNIELRLDGRSLPEKVYISKQGNKFLMDKVDKNIYKYSFNQVQANIPFHFEAENYQSSNYTIVVSDRPLIKNMLIEADYPAYVNIPDEKFFNATNLKFPVGTRLTWTLNTQSAETISIIIQQNSTILDNKLQGTNNLYTYSKEALQDFNYQFKIENKKQKKETSEEQKITVVPDSQPKIALNPVVDSTYFSTIIIEGEIVDDYGFSRLKLFYSTSKYAKNKKDFQSITIPFKKDINAQKYFMNWPIDSLFKDDDDQLTYYTEVWDNDQIQGPKSAQSLPFVLKFPTQENINTSINEIRQQTDNQLVKSISEAKDLEIKLSKLDEILKTKQALSFDDKQLIKEILEQSNKLDQKLKQIQDKLIENAEKRDKFSDVDKQLSDKSKELLDRVDEMKSDQEQELMQKINDLLKMTDKSEELQESASQLNKKQKNKLKELERLMQLFQRLELEYEIAAVNKELKLLATEQEKLSNDSTTIPDNILTEQKEINDSFEKIKDKLDKLKDKNQQLERPSAIKDTEFLENEIDQSQQESINNLNNKEQTKAKESQKKSSKKMSEMSEVMQQMQASMQGEQLKENIDNLRDIVDNLLKLSFRQEDIMSSLRDINPSDPRFLLLSERQLNLKDDGKIIEDSLTALAKRVFQIEAVVTKEMSALEETIDRTITSLQIREDSKAVSYQQQSMQHTNNLALLLDDIIQQMQMQSQGGQESGNDQQASPSEMQKAINQKTQELSSGQKSGRELAEGLAEIAAEQAKLRKLTEEMLKDAKDGNKPGGNGTSDIIAEMEAIEEALVNKRLNTKIINRQKTLVTKLLDAENSKNQQKEDNERKAETAQGYNNSATPQAIADYLDKRKVEIEQLNAAPPSLSPYYKEALIEYYKRIKIDYK